MQTASKIRQILLEKLFQPTEFYDTFQSFYSPYRHRWPKLQGKCKSCYRLLELVKRTHHSQIAITLTCSSVWWKTEIGQPVLIKIIFSWKSNHHFYYKLSKSYHFKTLKSYGDYRLEEVKITSDWERIGILNTK